MECESYTSQRQEMLSNLNTLGIVSPSLDLLLGKSVLNEELKYKVTQEVATFILKSNRVKDL